MKRDTCSRLWEVEADRNGRLQGDALEKFRRHQARCRTCSSEAERLETLGRALRAASPAPLDALSLRRMRQELLERADAGLMKAKSTSGWWSLRIAMSLAIVGVLLVGALIHWQVPGRNDREQGTQTLPRPYVVIPEKNAKWSERLEQGAYQVRLEEGTIRLAIRHDSGLPRVCVDVPDGRVEDLGTRFSVTVDLQRTQRIDVEEGTVLFRQLDGSVSLVTEGQVWNRHEVQPRREAISTTPGDHAFANGGATNHAPRTATTASRVVPSSQSSTLPSRGSASTNVDSEEDTAYLRILTLLRESRQSEARLAAQDYLRRFPFGFRRVEVERVTR